MNVVIKETGSNAVIAQGEENTQVRAFEGNWYFQPETVDMGKLEITSRTYTCPYKGTCYWIDLNTGLTSKPARATSIRTLAGSTRVPKPATNSSRIRSASMPVRPTGPFQKRSKGL